MPYWDKSLTETHPWEVDIDDPIYRSRLLAEIDFYVKKADIVVCQMVHTDSALELLKGIKVMYPHIPLVSEIDDNILSTPTYNPADSVYQPGSHFRRIAVEQFTLSDAMVVSTENLKEVYGEFNQNIYVIPNSLDFRIWDNLKHRRNTDFVRIGWAGGASHDEDLKIIEPVIHRILAENSAVKFCFVHGIPQFLRNIDRVECVSQFTRIDRYPQFLASRAIDINLAPLVDNAFNRGKSNLRWLEFAGMKVPTIASDVGHFRETITPLEDGMLCDTEDEWFDSLSWLIKDEQSRRKMGKNANALARRKFNVESNCFEYARVLAEIKGRGQVIKVPEIMEAA
jgi:glycosyltransferase involved in cell wall biosynthesis